MHKNLNLNTTGFGLFLYRIPILRPETGCLFLLSCFFLFGSGAKHFQSLKVIKRHHLLNYSLINCDKWGRSSFTKIYLFASPPLCFIKTMHCETMFYFCVLSCWWKSRMACHCLLCRSTWGRTSFILETAASGDHWSCRCCDISQQPTSVALLVIGLSTTFRWTVR